MPSYIEVSQEIILQNLIVGVDVTEARWTVSDFELAWIDVSALFIPQPSEQNMYMMIRLNKKYDY